MKLSAGFLLMPFVAALAFVAGNVTAPEPKSWLFKSDYQISQLIVDTRENDNIHLITAVLDSKEGRFLAQIRVSYVEHRLNFVSMLHIEKLP